MAMRQMFTLKVVANDVPLIGPRVHRAYARTAIALAMRAVADMKTRVHRVTGTLSRSLHASSREEGHEGDYPKAKGGSTIIEIIHPVWAGGDAYDIFAGSWLPYAAPEAARGGSHDFFTPALAVIERDMQRTFSQALREEGLF